VANYPFPPPRGPQPQVPPSSTIGSTIRTVGAQFVELFTANKWLRWTVFWLGWFMLSPTTIIPGSIAFGVGYSFYKERAVNLVTICAAYLGICAYLLLGHMVDWPEQVRLYMGWGMIFSVIVLAIRFPVFGWILLTIIATAGNRGYYRRRRW
jgi:hypothetical protein